MLCEQEGRDLKIKCFENPLDSFVRQNVFFCEDLYVYMWEIV